MRFFRIAKSNSMWTTFQEVENTFLALHSSLKNGPFCWFAFRVEKWKSGQLDNIVKQS